MTTLPCSPSLRAKTSKNTERSASPSIENSTSANEPQRCCVVCERNSPKSIFSCRYKVHERNVDDLQMFFERKSLRFGELCDRCYRLWYKHKRAKQPPSVPGATNPGSPAVSAKGSNSPKSKTLKQHSPSTAQGVITSPSSKTNNSTVKSRSKPQMGMKVVKPKTKQTSENEEDMGLPEEEEEDFVMAEEESALPEALEVKKQEDFVQEKSVSTIEDCSSKESAHEDLALSGESILQTFGSNLLRLKSRQHSPATELCCEQGPMPRLSLPPMDEQAQRPLSPSPISQGLGYQYVLQALRLLAKPSRKSRRKNRPVRSPHDVAQEAQAGCVHHHNLVAQMLMKCRAKAENEEAEDMGNEEFKTEPNHSLPQHEYGHGRHSQHAASFLEVEKLNLLASANHATLTSQSRITAA